MLLYRPRSYNPGAALDSASGLGSFLLPELDVAHSIGQQVSVVSEAKGDNEGQHNCQGLREENDAPCQKGSRDVDNSLHRLCHGDDDKEKSDQTVEKQKVEILVVEETDAVVHPWTVVIHL